MRIYTSTQTHSLGLKAGVILGLTVRALEVTKEDNFSLRGHTLRSALEEDKKKGLHPFILSSMIHMLQREHSSYLSLLQLLLLEQHLPVQ